MSVKLTTNLSQRLVLTPQLRQRIEMLQMTSVELSDLIQQQMLENPVLEEVFTQDETRELGEGILDHLASGAENLDLAAAAEMATDLSNGAASTNGSGDLSLNDNGIDGGGNSSEFTAESGDIHGEAGVTAAGEGAASGDDHGDEERVRDSFEEVDFDRAFQEYLDPGYRTQEFEHNPDAPTFEQFLTKPLSLAEHLTWQLRMNPGEDNLIQAAECVIGNLDPDGRLNATNEEIAVFGGWSEELVEQARQSVMRLDPVGCGARSAQECLLVQLEVRGYGSSNGGGNGSKSPNPGEPRTQVPGSNGNSGDGGSEEGEERLVVRLIREHLADLQPHKLPNLARQLGISIETVAAELELVRQLDPYPGRRYAADDAVAITPEIFIEKIDDDYVIHFADDGSPRLHISQSYQQMLQRPETTKETRDFIKDKVRSAVDLLRNIEHRQQTIYRVVEAIVRRQTDFLDKGVQFIKPMMLKDIAEDIGMHLSTVSRVVNRKYAHTPQGVIELRRFFTEGMTNEEGEEVSTRIIKLKIKKMIDEEDSRSPITDDQVVKILAKDGMKLSRRTVAKYRDQMRIPGSRERRSVV